MQKIEQGQLWRSRSGRAYRVLTIDSPTTAQPIVAMAVDTGMLERYAADGRYWPVGPDTDYDLVELFVPPLEAEGWAVVTSRDADMFPAANSLIVYGDQPGAEAACLPTQGERVIKVRVTEVRDGD